VALWPRSFGSDSRFRCRSKQNAVIAVIETVISISAITSILSLSAALVATWVMQVIHQAVLGLAMSAFCVTLSRRPCLADAVGALQFVCLCSTHRLQSCLYLLSLRLLARLITVSRSGSAEIGSADHTVA
jgi:hypothetical protein